MAAAVFENKQKTIQMYKTDTAAIIQLYIDCSCVMRTYIWQVQGYPLYHLVKAQTEKQAGAKEDALVSLQTAMSFITSKKSGINTQACPYGEKYRLPVLHVTKCLYDIHV